MKTFFLRYFQRNSFRKVISQVRLSNNDDGFNIFLKICRNTVDKLVPRKNKVHQE